MTTDPLIHQSDIYRGEVIGWGPTRAHWYSICSKHRDGREGCRMCAAGSYSNDWLHAIDGVIFRRARRTWLWWHNRPNSKSRRTLEGIFPGLRRRS